MTEFNIEISIDMKRMRRDYGKERFAEFYHVFLSDLRELIEDEFPYITVNDIVNGDV
jgi:hypothetical protein